MSKDLEYKKGHLRLVHRSVGEARKWKDGVDAALRRLGDGTSPLQKPREQLKRLKEELANAPNAERRVQLTAQIKALESQINRWCGRGRRPRPAGRTGPRRRGPPPGGRCVAGVVHRSGAGRRGPEGLAGGGLGQQAHPEAARAGAGPEGAGEGRAAGHRRRRCRSARTATAAGWTRRSTAGRSTSLIVDPTGETVLPASAGDRGGRDGCRPRIRPSSGPSTASASRPGGRSCDRCGSAATRSPTARAWCCVDGGAEVAPRLGRAFLDRFGGTIDDATGTLVLGEVKSSASAPTPPAKGGNVPPRPPVGGTRERSNRRTVRPGSRLRASGGPGAMVGSPRGGDENL